MVRHLRKAAKRLFWKKQRKAFKAALTTTDPEGVT